MALRTTSHDSDWQPKYSALLMALLCSLYMINLALSTKLFSLFGTVVSAGIIVFPLCTILVNMMTEVYGFNRTRQAIWLALIAHILFVVFAQFAVALPPAGGWRFQDGFSGLYSSSVRLALAGALSWTIGAFVNSYLMTYLKKRQQGELVALRFVVASAAGQFLNSLLFFLVAFAGVMPLKFLLIAVFAAWSARLAYEVLALPVSITVAKVLKQLEGIEHFDRQKLRII